MSMLFGKLFVWKMFELAFQWCRQNIDEAVSALLRTQSIQNRKGNAKPAPKGRYLSSPPPFFLK
jgi:hypothetical protein